jgi:hypothetical protein
MKNLMKFISLILIFSTIAFADYVDETNIDKFTLESAIKTYHAIYR